MSAYEAFASVYDIFMEQNDYDQWLRHICAIWKKFDCLPRSVVDLGCGTGRLTLALAARGLDVVGVDLSVQMLAEAEHRARQEGLCVQLVCQDMADLDLGLRADCILSLCDSMNYLTEDGELEQTLLRVRQHLKEGGIFLFDLNTEYKFREILGQNIFAASEDAAAYIWENDYDAEAKINEYHVSFFIEQKNGLYERTDEFHYERAYTLEEIKAGLLAAQLELLAVYDGYCFEEAKPQSERLLFVARRK